MNLPCHSFPWIGISPKPRSAITQHKILASEAVAGIIAGCLALGAAVVIGAPWPLATAAMALTAGMAIVTLVDARSFIIPDIISLPLIALGLLASGSWVHSDSANIVESNNWLGAVLPPLFVYAFGEAYRALRGRDGLGLGDVKLIAAAGAWVGLGDVSLVLSLAAASALTVVAARHAVRRGDAVALLGTRLAFGLYLAPAIWVVWMARTLLFNS